MFSISRKNKDKTEACGYTRGAPGLLPAPLPAGAHEVGVFAPKLASVIVAGAKSGL
jgi:hypothetical protein